MRTHQKYTGRRICDILKDIRQQVAFDNDISLHFEKCTYQGECTGTCPRCESELAIINEQLKERKSNNLPILISKYSLNQINVVIDEAKEIKSP